MNSWSCCFVPGMLGCVTCHCVPSLLFLKGQELFALGDIFHTLWKGDSKMSGQEKAHQPPTHDILQDKLLCHCGQQGEWKSWSQRHVQFVLGICSGLFSVLQARNKSLYLCNFVRVCLARHDTACTLGICCTTIACTFSWLMSLWLWMAFCLKAALLSKLTFASQTKTRPSSEEAMSKGMLNSYATCHCLSAMAFYSNLLRALFCKYLCCLYPFMHVIKDSVI